MIALVAYSFLKLMFKYTSNAGIDIIHTSVTHYLNIPNVQQFVNNYQYVNLNLVENILPNISL